MGCQQDWFCPVLKHIWTWDIIREGEIEYKFEGLTHLVPSDPFADLCFSSWEALGGSGRATAGRMAATLIRESFVDCCGASCVSKHFSL